MKATLAVLGALSLAASASANTAYGQCGGKGFSGDTTCPSGYTCKYSNDYYSQCLPGSSGGNPTTTTTTTTTRQTTQGGGGTCNPVTITSTSTSVSTVTLPAQTVTVTVNGGGNGPTTTTTTTRTTTTTTRPTSAPVTTTTTTTSSGGSTPTGTPSGLTAYPATGGSSVAGNPYAGLPRYVNNFYYKEVQDSIAASGDATYGAKADKVSRMPSFFWLDTISALDQIPIHLANAAAQSNGKPILAEFVIYDLPGRDCHAFASNGELKKGDITTYKTQYIDAAFAAFSKKDSNVHLSLLIEPDSLPNIATNIGQQACDSQSQTDYTAGVAYAIAKLSQLPNTSLYLDSAHGGWLGWPDNQTKMVPVFQSVLTAAKQINSSATIRGFASNTANYSAWDGKGACPAQAKCPLTQGMYDYNPCIDEKTFISQFGAKLATAGLPNNWIHDTSRNGQVGIRKDWGSWCNVKGAGIGARPQSEPSANVDAFVWAKPPGESDGVSGPAGTPRLDSYCDPTTSYGQDALSGAPQAGKWFDAQFQMLVTNAVPAL